MEGGKATRTHEGDELPGVASRLSRGMPRAGVIAAVGLLLAFASGWLVGRAGGSVEIPGRLEAPSAMVPGGTASAVPVTTTPSAPADASPDTTAVNRLRIAPPDPQSQEPSDASPEAAVPRRELTPSAVEENGGLVRSALFSAAHGLAESCYVELREATLGRLAPNLNSSDWQRALAECELMDARPGPG